MKLFLCALLAVPLPAEQGYRLEPASKKTKLIWSGVLLTASVVDEWTTHAAVSRGVHEINPLPAFLGPTGRKMLKLGTGVGVIKFAEWLHANDHKRQAHVLVGTVALIFILGAVSNHRKER